MTEFVALISGYAWRCTKIERVDDTHANVWVDPYYKEEFEKCTRQSIDKPVKVFNTHIWNSFRG